MAITGGKRAKKKKEKKIVGQRPKSAGLSELQKQHAAEFGKKEKKTVRDVPAKKAEPVTKRATIELGGTAKETTAERQARQRGFVKSLVTGKATKEEIATEAVKFAKGLGVTATVGAAVFGGAAVLAGRTAVATAATVGKFPALGLKVATNAKTLGATANLLSKIGFTVGGAAALTVAAIGTYPFSGFIKEEALQTLSLGVRSAVGAGDVEGAETALDLQDEILREDLWEKIISAVPFANVVKELRDFYKAAKAKVAIDKKIVEDIKIQQETGESEDEKWARIREEEAEQDRAAVDYYNEQRKIMVDWEREAEKAARAEDAAFWREERAKQAKMEAEDRKAIADFWLAYRKESLKLANDNRPSNLNFGLL